MRDTEGFPGETLQQIAGQRLARRERDGVYDAIEPVPAVFEGGENGFDFRVVAYVAGKNKFGIEIRRQLLHPCLQALPGVGKSQLRSLPPHRFGDAISNRAIGKQPGD